MSLFPKFNMTEPDVEACMNLFRTAVKELNGTYPSGAIGWACDNRPDLVLLCRGAEDSVDRSIIDGDIEQTELAIARYLDCYRKLFNVYTDSGATALHSTIR